MLRWLWDKIRRQPRKQVIILSPRWFDIWAGSATGIHGAGPSMDAALGNLILNHPDQFNIKILLAFGDHPHRPLSGSYVTIPEEQYDAIVRAAGWSNK